MLLSSRKGNPLTIENIPEIFINFFLNSYKNYNK